MGKGIKWLSEKVKELRQRQDILTTSRASFSFVTVALVI